MKTKRLDAPAPTTAAPQPNYGSYHGNASKLAGLRAKAVLAWMVAASLLVAGGWLAYEFDRLPLLLVGAVLALPVYVYATHLWLNTNHVQRELWRHEEDAGQDLDGDGVIGRPRRETRYIEVKGQMIPFAEEVTYDGEDTEPVDLVPGFNAPVEVVLDFFRLASERGLGRARLVTEPRLSIGNGLQLSKGIWTSFTTEAARRGWIVDGGNGNGYRWGYQPDSIIRAIEEAAMVAGRAGGRPGRPGDVPSEDWLTVQSSEGKGMVW